MTQKQTRIAAVILAGGKGERLGGVNKAFLGVGGRRLIDRAMDVVVGCDPILVATGRAVFDLPTGATAVLDQPDRGGGPLAGVLAAVDALEGSSADLLLSLAVDTPLFPTDFLARALAALGDARAILAAYGAQDYPTNALWRVDAIRQIPPHLHSLKGLAASIGAGRLDYAERCAGDPFLNVNTPADLAMLEGLLGRGVQG
jgi:molybdopterin-guanine dinucleotide biosynthesis protein A